MLLRSRQAAGPAKDQVDHEGTCTFLFASVSNRVALIAMGTIWRLGAYKCKKIKGWLPGIIIAQGLDTLNPKAIIGAIPVAERSSRERCAAPLGSRCAAPHLI